MLTTCKPIPYAKYMAAGTVPGEDDIPEDLLRAMAVLIGRGVDSYVGPTACAGAAALVVLAVREGAF